MNMSRATFSASTTPALQLGRPCPLPRRVRFLKRCIDLLGATVGLVLLGPVMLLVGLAIRLDSSGPAIYRQRRQGGDGHGGKREFVMLKFRSMRQDAEAGTGPQWATAQDPRVTRVGRWVRKSRLDELPQLWNVLKGEMSIVGPRPERTPIIARLSPQIPGYEDRVGAFKPGITGWAQIHCGYDTSVETVRTKVAYDLAYAAHLYNLRSYLSIEVRIIVGTIGVILTGRGAQ